MALQVKQPPPANVAQLGCLNGSDIAATGEKCIDIVEAGYIPAMDRKPLFPVAAVGLKEIVVPHPRRSRACAGAACGILSGDWRLDCRQLLLQHVPNIVAVSNKGRTALECFVVG